MVAFLAARTLTVLRRSRPLCFARSLCVRNSVDDNIRDVRTSSADLRGFALLRFDVNRLSRLLRLDTSVLTETNRQFEKYDVHAIMDYYDGRPLSFGLRALRVAVPLALWLIRVRRIDKWLYRQQPDELRADQLRRLLCWAGPVYLKIGQAIGNRPDIVGATYGAALQRLVDDVGTFDSELAASIVRRELGVSNLNEVFAEFGVEAVASASLGQVHKARLHSGEWVAVKVQRPTVPLTAPIDIYILRRAALLAKRRFKLRSDVVGIIDEFASRLWEELDYVNEADNTDRFRALYAENNDDIYVPQVYRAFSTRRVLTMEWVDGSKAPWFPKEDAMRLINVGVQCSLRQLLDTGFLHSDPHIGNLMRRNGTNQLVYLDFGMCTSIDQEARYNLIASIVHLINKDYANLANDFIKLGFLPEETDTAPLVPLLEEAFGDASQGGSVTNLSFGRLTGNLTALATSSPIRIPVYFTLLIRSLTILEGIALQTDVDFKIVDQSYPFVVSKILTEDAPVLNKALENVLIDSETKRIRWNRVRSVAVNLPGNARGDGDGASSTALTEVSNNALELVLDFALSERGEFFRKALELELTDTVDAIQLALAHRVSRLSGGLLPAPMDAPDEERVQVGFWAAEVLRKRVPALLQLRNGANLEASLARRRKLSASLRESARIVVADITERNTRRVLRQALGFFLGVTLKS